jgi:hypothetical protein
MNSNYGAGPKVRSIEGPLYDDHSLYHVVAINDNEAHEHNFPQKEGRNPSEGSCNDRVKGVGFMGTNLDLEALCGGLSRKELGLKSNENINTKKGKWQ